MGSDNKVTEETASDIQALASRWVVERYGASTCVNESSMRASSAATLRACAPAYAVSRMLLTRAATFSASSADPIAALDVLRPISAVVAVC